MILMLSFNHKGIYTPTNCKDSGFFLKNVNNLLSIEKFGKSIKNIYI